MKLIAHNQIELFDLLKTDWQDLLSRSIADCIFSTWEWQSCWWQAYHPGKLWVIECRSEDDGRLLGLAPWFIEAHPQQGRIARMIGCVEVTDYLDLIIDKAHVEEVLRCFAIYLVEHKAEYDILDLCNLPETSPTYSLFPSILNEHGFDARVSEQEVCPVIALPATWDEYLDSLDKKQRHEIRRKIRRAEGTSDEVSWYIVGEAHNLDSELDRFMALMASSHSQKSEFLHDPQNEAFFRMIVPIAFHKNWLQLSFITIGGQAAAAYLNFVYDRRVLVYNSGLLPNLYGHLSPGIVLLAYNIRYAIEAGLKVFDFLRGNEIYKYRMGGKDTRVYMLRASSPEVAARSASV